MSIETPPQPRFRMWDRVGYRNSESPRLYTVIGINWNRYEADYEYRLMHQEQGLDECEEDYVYGRDKDDFLYLVCRPGTTCLYQRPDGTPTTEAEGNQPLPPSEERVIADRKQHTNLTADDRLQRSIDSLNRIDAMLEELQNANRRELELIRLFGTLFASRKEGEPT